MASTTKPFFRLTAEDLMSRDVVVIPQEATLRAAARLLCRERISGAPVVDELGRCVGVLSATDFVRWTEKGGAPALSDELTPGCVCADWQMIDLEGLPRDDVRRHMTPDPVTVTPGTPVRDLARLMIDAHIHRLIVVDERRRPLGVVSSTDVLAAVARCRPEE